MPVPSLNLAVRDPSYRLNPLSLFKLALMSNSGQPSSDVTHRGSRFRWGVWVPLALLLVLIFLVAWVGVRGLLAKQHLERAVSLVDTVRSQITDGDTARARSTATNFEQEAGTAHSLTSDPIWRTAELVPFFGPNLRAVGQIGSIVAEVATGAVSPAAGVLDDVGADSFAPKNGRIDLQPLVDAQPAVGKAAMTLARAEREADTIDTTTTLSPVTEAVNRLRNALTPVTRQAEVANKVVQLAPAMLGNDGDRNYLLLFQNNAELRAGGGIPGAVALLHAENGSIKLESQVPGGSVGPFDQPVLPLSDGTKALYGDITGRYMQDVTLTPRFDVSAKLAREMWRQKFGLEADGVLAMDPVTLGYLLAATGPVRLPTGDTLTAENAVRLLLSDVYAKYPDPEAQDAFFASAASAVFEKISDGDFDAKKFVSALTEGTSEDRLRLWSAQRHEQQSISGTALAGELPTATASTRQFGVFLNDGTGSKMDYYLDKKVSVGSSVCRKDGRPTSVIEVTLKNTAPVDSATSLPGYVTGEGAFGTDPGKIKTLVAVYAPSNAIYVGASQDGAGAALQTFDDGKHPVAQLQTLLAPGESTTFRVAFLGEARFASAGVEARSTPGVHQTKAELLRFDCSRPVPVD